MIVQVLLIDWLQADIRRHEYFADRLRCIFDKALLAHCLLQELLQNPELF